MKDIYFIAKELVLMKDLAVSLKDLKLGDKGVNIPKRIDNTDCTIFVAKAGYVGIIPNKAKSEPKTVKKSNK